MNFSSDNTSPVPQEILDALASANAGAQMPYGSDDMMSEVREKIRNVFQAPDAAVYLVATGTAANSLALATMSQPFETIFCSPVAHIHEDECNAPEFYTGGAKLTLVGKSDKITSTDLERAIANEETRDVHGPQRGPVSITQLTEKGRAYSVDEIKALSDVAKSFGCKVHLDGARFANAQVALGCSAADMTWRSGVDAVTFGGTKNGLMGVEAVVFFDPKCSREFELRRKRGGHLFSKNRYLSAQMLGYLKGDLWLKLAQKANEMGQKLTAALANMPDVTFDWQPDANLIFFNMPRSMHKKAMDAGAQYYLWGGDIEGEPNTMLTGRLVCSWSTSEDEISKFIQVLSK